MLSRTALRTARTARISQKARRNVRFASDSTSPTGAAGGSGALTGGLAGAGAALAVGYGWYHFSGAKTAVNTAKEAQSYITYAKDTLKVQFQEKTPDTNQALQTLKDASLKYASFIPGGRGYVESAFNDLETIRQKHGGEVDDIVRDAYEELRDASKKGLSLDTASETTSILSKHFERLLSLAGDAGEEILNNHPELKEKLGGSTEQLKQLADRVGPEAKKQVDETWQQIREVVQQGLTIDSAYKVQRLVQEKMEKIRQMGEEAFNQGFEQLKPMLDKASPQVRKVVEENMDALKQGNVSQGIEQIRKAISSGNTDQLQSYIQQAKQQVQNMSSSSINSWLEQIPNGGEIIPQLQKLKEVAEKRGDEATDLVKDIMKEIKEVFDRKSTDVEKLYEKSKDDVKKST